MARVIACAVVREDPPQVFVAEDLATLNWVLALRLIATADRRQMSADLREELSQALIEERWGDAVAAWIDRTGVPVDVDPSMELYQGADVALAPLELQFQPLFER